MSRTEEQPISMNKLRDFLATLRSGRPGYGMIRTAMNSGMPYHIDPLTGRFVFMASEVKEWWMKRRTVSTRIADNAAAAVRGRRTRRG